MWYLVLFSLGFVCSSLVAIAFQRQLAQLRVRPLSATPHTRGWFDAKWPISKVLLPILATSLLLIGCHGGGPEAMGNPSKSTPVLTQQMGQEADAAHKILVEGPDSILAMLPKIPQGLVSVDAAQGRVKEADSHIQRIQEAAPQAAKAAEADRKTIANQGKQIEEYKHSDPVKTWLQRIGVGMVVLALVAIGIGIWTGKQVLYIGGFVFVGVGLAVLTLAYFLTAIQWLIGGIAAVAVVAGVVWLILHRKVLSDIAKDAENWIPKSPPGTITLASFGGTLSLDGSSLPPLDSTKSPSSVVSGGGSVSVTQPPPVTGIGGAV